MRYMRRFDFGVAFGRLMHKLGLVLRYGWLGTEACVYIGCLYVGTKALRLEQGLAATCGDAVMARSGTAYTWTEIMKQWILQCW